MTQPASEHVYVLGTADGRTVKIGRTINVAKRVSEIQSMSPTPLRLLWSHPGGHELETNLHRQFSALRAHGEWFVFTNDPLPLIKWAVANEPWQQPRVSLRKRRPRIVRPTAEQRRAGREAAVAQAVELDPALVTAVEALITAVQAIEDPTEHYKATYEAEARVKAALKERQKVIANGLRDQGRSWREIGELLSVSSQRAYQIATGTR